MKAGHDIKVVGNGKCAQYHVVLKGLRAAGPNDLGSVRKLLKEWPEDVFITGAGIEASPLSEPAKAFLIFKQMDRVCPEAFVLQSFASNLADVFTKVGLDDCQKLSSSWWKGLNDKNEHLRIKGELNLKHGMRAVETWRNHELEVFGWNPLGVVEGYLHPKGPAKAPVHFKINAQNAEKVSLQVAVYTPDLTKSTGSQCKYGVDAAPTEVLEILTKELAPLLPENAENDEIKELRQRAEETEAGSVKPAIEAMQKVLDHRSKVLVKAEELLAGPSTENVGQTTRSNLSKLAENVVEDPDSEETT
ncbi:hypothetical protein ACFL6C_12505 [Myxococcota bacterium]